MVIENEIVRLADQPWQDAAGRVSGLRAIVLFGKELPKKDMLGAAFWVKGYPVILIKHDLDLWTKIKILIHEALHFALGDVAELVKTWEGYAWKHRVKNPKRATEQDVIKVTDEKMQVVKRNFEVFKRITPRPVGYWTGDLPFLSRRLQADILSLV